MHNNQSQKRNPQQHGNDKSYPARYISQHFKFTISNFCFLSLLDDYTKIQGNYKVNFVFFS